MFAGTVFFETMAYSRNTIDKVYYYMSNDLKKETGFREQNGTKEKYTAELKCLPNNCNISFYEENQPTEKTAIDLGLSVKWASCNLGATQNHELGTKYPMYDLKKIWENNPELFETKTTYLGPKVLGANLCKSKYDYAYVSWGGNWRMPTYEELKELVNKCKWEGTVVKGVYGAKITGVNGKSIFLPAVTITEVEYDGVKTGTFQGAYLSGTYKYDLWREVLALEYVGSFSSVVSLPSPINTTYTGAGVNDSSENYWFIRPVSN